VSTLSTHVLDAVSGTPASGLPVALERRSAGLAWTVLGRASTDDDGRIGDLAPSLLEPGVYRLVFDTDAYAGQGSGFYPEVVVAFRITEERHYHVPLLLSPFAYSTYRGS